MLRVVLIAGVWLVVAASCRSVGGGEDASAVMTSPFDIDLVAETLTFRNHKVDPREQDGQHVFVTVRNQGVTATHRDISSTLFQWRDGRRVRQMSRLMALQADGSLAAAAVYPRDKGALYSVLPQGTLRHCDVVTVTIDYSHELQLGQAEVYANDRQVMIAKEQDNTTPCQ